MNAGPVLSLTGYEEHATSLTEEMCCTVVRSEQRLSLEQIRLHAMNDVEDPGSGTSTTWVVRGTKANKRAGLLTGLPPQDTDD